jgi:alanine or glycine:cation symporter, AGCS family
MVYLSKISEFIYYFSDNFLVYFFLPIFLAGVILTFKFRLIQFRAFPMMLKMLFGPQKESVGSQGISPRSALLISMSTSIGMSNIVGPVIAIGMGGPGALAGFMIATIFGAATTFAEVAFAVHYRKKGNDGSFYGGPMSYLSQEFSQTWGKIYAYLAGILLITWSANQANNLAVLLEPKGFSPYLTGALVTVAVTFILSGGVKRLGEVSDRLVPFMFALYTGATSWIIFSNLNKIPEVMALLVSSVLSTSGAAGACLGFGFHQAMRWGLARATQTTEAGVGTNTFPHVVAQGTTPFQQGVLAMASVYANGIICTLSGLTILVSDAWKIPGAAFDIRMISNILEANFPMFGPKVLVFSSFMFAFGTILGNNYNGSQCFLHATKGKWITGYRIISAIAVFLGCISDAKFIWTIIDFFILPVAIPHTIAILILAFKKPHVLSEDESELDN